jgi:hypothetical protein
MNLKDPFRQLTIAVALALASSSAPAFATMYGSLGNFDIINDTGQTAHGFEIELDGCLPSNVFSTFGAPYNRYGTPTITTDGTNTFVRYESAYSGGAWAVGTTSGTYAPTGGHSLFFPQYGGSPDYPNVPGDHFGVAINSNPTNTIYHWLLDSGNADGTLVKAGTSVMVPAPVFSVVPPANPVNQAGVQAVVQAPPPEVGQQLGDAIWAKVFTTVIEHPNPVDLNELVLGNAAVPPDSETEVEWQLLQTDPNRPDLAEKVDNSDLGAANEAVTRRYEFYKYIGAYDPENHEALNEAYDPAFVGDFLGNQNVAANFAPIPEPSTFVLGGLGAIGLWFAGWRRRKAIAA